MAEKQPQSIKEYWLDPKRNRRHSSGRREADYSVCPYHDAHEKQNDEDKSHFCAKIKRLGDEHDADVKTLRGEHDADIVRVHERIEKMEGRIVGWRTIGILVSIFLAMFTLFGTVSLTMFNSISSDLKVVEAAIFELKR
jgi:hypothetical protein